jgi:3-oxo-5-alpha-steroid 4-dehydrogenase 1
MGATFCAINGFIQGEWIFFLAPKEMYTIEWLSTPQFIIGVALFFIGMFINLHSDHVIRHLRKPGDTKHYLPKKGVYKYVTSANYFGEIVEWTGFAIASWSWAGVIFVIWTCANLVPRSNSIYKRYKKEFSEEFDEKRLKRVFPFVY